MVLNSANFVCTSVLPSLSALPGLASAFDPQVQPLWETMHLPYRTRYLDESAVADVVPLEERCR